MYNTEVNAQRVDMTLCTQALAGLVFCLAFFSLRKTKSLKILQLQMCGMSVESLQADPRGFALKQQLAPTVSPLMSFSQTHHSYTFSSSFHSLPTVKIQLLHILDYNYCALDRQPNVVLIPSSATCVPAPNMASSIFGINCSSLLLTVWNYAGYVTCCKHYLVTQGALGREGGVGLDILRR